MSESAAPRLYNANEDTPGDEPEWHLEVTFGPVEGPQVRRRRRRWCEGHAGVCMCVWGGDAVLMWWAQRRPTEPTPLTPGFLFICLRFLLQEEIDALVGDGFHFEAVDMRVTFSAGADAWALKFTAPAAFEGFLQRYNKASFENRFGLEQTDEGEAKVCGVRCAAAAAGCGVVGWQPPARMQCAAGRAVQMHAEGGGGQGRAPPCPTMPTASR